MISCFFFALRSVTSEEKLLATTLVTCVLGMFKTVMRHNNNIQEPKAHNTTQWFSKKLSWASSALMCVFPPQCQAYSTEQQIRKEFERLHQFLQAEEDARIAALEEEAKQKIIDINKTMEGVSKAMSTLSNTIKAIKEAIGSADVPFLQV